MKLVTIEQHPFRSGVFDKFIEGMKVDARGAVSASNLPLCVSGKASHGVGACWSQRSTSTASGSENGCNPGDASRARCAAMAGSSGTGVEVYEVECGGSVGSWPATPRTSNSCSARPYQGSSTSYPNGHAGETPSQCSSAAKSRSR